MKIVVTGGRNFNDADLVWRTLDSMKDITRIAFGCATGTDYHALRWAKIKGIPHKVYVADWEIYGNAAGPIRNKEMLVTEEPDLLLAFPGGRGTLNCIKTAIGLNIPVHVVSEEGVIDR